MDSQSMLYATQKAVKKKFGRKQALVSKVVPHYPQGCEREYIRIMNAYMKLLNTSIAAYIPQIRALLDLPEVQTDAKDKPKEERLSGHPSVREIAAFNLEMNRITAAMLKEFEYNQGLFDLYGKLKRLSKQSQKLSIAEWKRVVKRTLGIDIMEDYYKGEKFQRLFDKWVADNVELITKITDKTLDNMRSIVKNGYLSGASTKTIGKQIQEAYDVSKSRAQFLARDQTAKLNAQVTQEQQRDAGVDEYVWRTVGNISTFPNSGRVRKDHARLNNKRFKYSEPPVVDEKTGRRANPGEDYSCRCVGLPVFDLDTVVLPWEADAKNGGE